MKTLTSEEYDAMKYYDRVVGCSGGCIVGGVVSSAWQTFKPIGSMLIDRGYLVSEKCHAGGPCTHLYHTATGKLAVYCYELARGIIQNALTEG